MQESWLRMKLYIRSASITPLASLFAVYAARTPRNGAPLLQIMCRNFSLSLPPAFHMLYDQKFANYWFKRLWQSSSERAREFTDMLVTYRTLSFYYSLQKRLFSFRNSALRWRLLEILLLSVRKLPVLKTAVLLFLHTISCNVGEKYVTLVFLLPNLLQYCTFRNFSQSIFFFETKKQKSRSNKRFLHIIRVEFNQRPVPREYSSWAAF